MQNLICTNVLPRGEFLRGGKKFFSTGSANGLENSNTQMAIRYFIAHTYISMGLWNQISLTNLKYVLNKTKRFQNNQLVNYGNFVKTIKLTLFARLTLVLLTSLPKL